MRKISFFDIHGIDEIEKNKSNQCTPETGENDLYLFYNYSHIFFQNVTIVILITTEVCYEVPSMLAKMQQRKSYILYTFEGLTSYEKLTNEF